MARSSAATCSTSPTARTTPTWSSTPASTQAAFFAWVQREGFGPGFVPRNAKHAQWSNRLDISIHQDFPVGFDRVSGRFFVRMYNLMNFLDDNWGKVYDAHFFSQQVVNSVVNDDGQFVFTRFSRSERHQPARDPFALAGALGFRDPLLNLRRSFTDRTA